MNIAIYIKLKATGPLPGGDFFLEQLLPGIVNHHPEHSFLLVIYGPPRSPGDRPLAPKLTVHHEPKSKTILHRWWWYYVKLPRLLKATSSKALLIVNTVMPNPGITQTVFFEDEYAVLHEVNIRSLQKTKMLLTSPWLADEFRKRLNTSSVITIPRRGILPGYKTADEDEHVVTRDTFTGRRNYFLYAGPVDKEVLVLIQAFSVFKKRQKSDWKLVLAGDAPTHDPFIKSLGFYKYRDDLIIITNPATITLAKLVAAAYAMVFTRLISPLLIQECMYAEVPVIAPDEPEYRNIGENVLLYYDRSGPVAIAENLMTLYKDEDLRRRMIDAGRTKVVSFNWDELSRRIVEQLSIS